MIIIKSFDAELNGQVSPKKIIGGTANHLTRIITVIISYILT